MKITFSVQFKRVFTFILLMSIFIGITIGFNYLLYAYTIESAINNNTSTFIFGLLQTCIIFLSIVFFNVIKVDYYEN